MTFPTHDTDWAESAKGNHWRRENGMVLVVGRKSDGTFWAMVDGIFVKRSFPNKSAAMAAVEDKPRGHDGQTWY